MLTHDALKRDTARRVKRLQAMMKDKDLDALIIVGQCLRAQQAGLAGRHGRHPLHHPRPSLASIPPLAERGRGKMLLKRLRQSAKLEGHDFLNT